LPPEVDLPLMLLDDPRNLLQAKLFPAMHKSAEHAQLTRADPKISP